jgi:hypothetical protein
MPSRDDHPKWWQVYLTFPLLIVLFVLDSRLKISPRGHTVVQIGLILLVYGLVHLWLSANARALSNMDRGQIDGRIRVIQIHPYPLDDEKSDEHPIFQFPDSEIKGVLSDTFEMDYIDAESYSMDEVSQAKQSYGQDLDKE